MHIIGKSKKQILNELGEEFNYYHSNLWSYCIKTNWTGRKTHLVLHFKNEAVKNIEIKKGYGKLFY